MIIRESETATQIGVALKEADFEISRICCSRPSCFDLAARKDKAIVFLKACCDVASFSRRESLELKVLAGRVSAASLVVSRKTHDKPLEDDTVYSRYGVRVVTEKTIKNIAFKTGNPLVYAGPGGYFVEVDGLLIEKKRKESGLSVGQLAEMIKVSRRTLYGYERSMAKASIGSAYNLAKILGAPVAKSIDILQKTRKQRQCLVLRAGHAFVGQPLLRRFFRKFAFCDISPLRMAPFDFIMNVPDEEYVVFGAIALRGERNFDERTKEILSVSRVVNARPVVIVETPENFSNDVFTISADELSMMRSPDDLFGSF
jgi:putative transcriptional regulator